MSVETAWTPISATPFLLDVLMDLGEETLAETILWQSKRPGWLYETDHGATTIWEAWDADEARKGGRFVSFNHYAFGCVDDFIARRIAGLQPEEPGLHKKFAFPPAAGRVDFTGQNLLLGKRGNSHFCK